MNILLTGGSGFIGRHLVQSLVQAGFKITVLSREDSEKALPEGVRVEKGDITKPETYCSLLAETNALVHLASELRREEKMEDVNHKAAAALARNASERGVSTFIHLSSVGVSGFGFHPAKAVCTEETPCTPQNEYERTKWLGEQEVLRAGDKGMRTVVLRPTNVYGEDHPRQALLMLFRRVKSRSFLPYTRGSMVNYLYVGDLVSVIACSLQNAEMAGVFQVGTPSETGDFLQEIACELDEKPSGIPLPAFAVRIAATLAGGENGQRLRSLCNFAEYSSQKLLQTIPVTFDEQAGIKNTIQWYQNNKML
ncbi:MAG: NAD(P)-dependent oxidoreductase [Bacteroidia bacterium]|nr:NAD(P)-dependent oxidoreductase [Bacteroidia bacterium]